MPLFVAAQLTTLMNECIFFFYPTVTGIQDDDTIYDDCM